MKLCFVTATRAEYGLLRSLMQKIKADSTCTLQLIVTGAHLVPALGLTINEIEQDGFSIDEKLNIVFAGDTPQTIVQSLALATLGLGQAFERLQPDGVVILGDRYEALAAAQVALLLQIPIIHIHGGENSFGAIDDAIRHAITKMASWHFTSSEIHRQRVVQLGEHPSRVFNVGALGIEAIKKQPLMKREQVYADLQIPNAAPFFVITLHPETMGDAIDTTPLLQALEAYKDRYIFVFTKANADAGGMAINRQLEAYVTKNNRQARLFDSLGHLRYLSAVRYAAVVIGNSSSGLIEVPYLHVPTINIGNRQKGRQHPSSVIHCENQAIEIQRAIHKVLSMDFDYEEIYGDGTAAEQIFTILKQLPALQIVKEFYDL